LDVWECRDDLCIWNSWPDLLCMEGIVYSNGVGRMNDAFFIGVIVAVVMFGALAMEIRLLSFSDDEEEQEDTSNRG